MSILRLPEVLKKTGLSRSAIYALIAQNLFPAPIRIGRRAVGWVDEEITGWMHQRMMDRRSE